MDYVISFVLGGFVGMILTCCVAASNNNNEEE